VSNTSDGFAYSSFEECLDMWEVRAMTDRSISVRDTFKLYFDPPQGKKGAKKGPRDGKARRRP